MNILFYKWSAYNADLTILSLKKLGHNVEICDQKFEGYEIDSSLMQKLIFAIHTHKSDCIFSINYIPLLASVANSCNIKYISWTEDSPSFPLYSPTKNYPCNYEFIFDKEEYLRLGQLNSSRVHHVSLASAPFFFDSQIAKCSPNPSDVCFLGTLYNDTDFDRIDFPSKYYEGYVNGLIQAQKNVYGCNFIEEVLPDKLAHDLLELCEDNVPEGYNIDERYAAAYVLERKITGLERIEYLSEIGKKYNLTIYTGSKPDSSIRATFKGYAKYETEMPRIFHDAKINLHFAPRNIHSGVSLRVFDVLACHGFLITTWQPEILELFDDGKNLVVFSSQEELLDKIEYYLNHDAERTKIAEKGYKTICQNYTYEKVLSEIIETAFAE